MKKKKFLATVIGVTAAVFGFILAIISGVTGVNHLFNHGVSTKELLFFLPISLWFGILIAFCEEK